MKVKELKDKSDRASPKTDEDEISSDGGGKKSLHYTRKRPLSKVRRMKIKRQNKVKHNKTKK